MRNKNILRAFIASLVVVTIIILFHVYTFQQDHVKNTNKDDSKLKKISEENINEFMSKYRTIHERRTNHTRKICEQHKNEIPKMTILPHLLVDEKHKLVYCQIPKVGTTSWSRVFLLLKGRDDYSTVMQLTRRGVNSAWKTRIPQVSSYPPEKQQEILATYTKFMFVRHPLSRLLSGFNDKLKPTENANLTAIQNQIGWRALRKFRPSSTTYDIRFEDFIKMVISGSSSAENAHWREAHRLCYPCDIDYDIYGKFEDIDNDSKYILTKSGVGHVAFPGTGKYFTDSSNREQLKKHYANVSILDTAAIYNKFKFDFSLFDYEIPIF